MLPALLLLTQASLADEDMSGRETQDRRVDRVALDAQQRAVAKLRSLVGRYRGTEREPVLMMKLAHILYQSAGLEFRITHGSAQKAKTAANLGKYRKILVDAVEVFSSLIRKFPEFEEIDLAYFERASAQHELDKRELARRDYLFITQHFPKSRLVIQSYMALADYAIDANQHRLAITYLSKVEAQPEDTHYPFAIYKMAWSYFNLKEIPHALSYLMKHVEYFNARKRPEPEMPLLEHSLLDVPAFYLEAMEEKLSGYSTDQVLIAFSKYEKGELLGKMLLRFAKLLRSAGKDSELLKFQDLVVRNESMRPETLEVLQTALEHYSNEKNFENIAIVTESIRHLDELTQKKMRSLPTYGVIQKGIFATADLLQKLTVKSKDPALTKKLTTSLVTVYSAFVSIVEESDPRIPRTHYNLAETYFEIKDFEAATDNYKWVLDHWKKETELDRKDVRLKIISSRYQALKNDALIPKELTASALEREDPLKLEALKPRLAEWIKWVDSYQGDFGYSAAAFEDFRLEADRAIYAQGQIAPALERLIRLAQDRPEAKVGIPAASLVLDTYLVSKSWQKLYEASDRFLRTQWKDKDFIKKLTDLASNSYYKTVELAYEKKNYDDALKRADRYLSMYPQTGLAPDCLYLASRIAIDAKKEALAAKYLSELVTKYPAAQNRSQAVLARAQLEESHYDFDSALKDYRFYLEGLKTPKKDQVHDLLGRIFLFTWLGEEGRDLDCSKFETYSEFKGELATDCDRYQALVILKSGKKPAPELIKAGLKGTKDNRTLWAAIALRWDQEMSFRERLELVKVASTQWNHLEALAKFALIPALSHEIPRSFETARESLKTISPLKASVKAITKRIDSIGEIETAAARAMKLPWGGIKAPVLREVGQIYIDFSAELAALPPPKDLSEQDAAEYRTTADQIIKPFQEKGNKLRAQAFEIASSLGVEQEILESVIPEKTEKRGHGKTIDLSLLDDIEDISNWRRLSSDSDEPPARLLKGHWVSAVKKRSWGAIAFFVQELKEKKLAKGATLQLMRAVALSAAGAQAEALAELESVKSDVDENIRARINEILYSQYFASHADEKAQSIAREIKRRKS